MQLEHTFSELQKTGIPGIILENPNSSTLHIFAQLVHLTITNVSSSTKSFKSWSSIHSTFHLMRLLTGPLKKRYNIYEYFFNYSKLQINCRQFFNEVYKHKLIEHKYTFICITLYLVFRATTVCHHTFQAYKKSLF